jgi:hypothetical protein
MNLMKRFLVWPLLGEHSCWPRSLLIRTTIPKLCAPATKIWRWQSAAATPLCEHGSAALCPFVLTIGFRFEPLRPIFAAYRDFLWQFSPSPPSAYSAHSAVISACFWLRLRCVGFICVHRWFNRRFGPRIQPPLRWLGTVGFGRGSWSGGTTSHYCVRCA